MKQKPSALIFATLVIFVVMLPTRWLTGQSTGSDGADNPNARPHVTEDDVQIVLRAQDILDSQSKWNRADTRVCQRMLNDPTTTFADVQKFFRLLQDRVAARLKEELQGHNK